MLNYLKQASTYSGIIKVLSAVGLFTLTPETADIVAENAVHIVTGVLAILGAFDIFRNEKKDG